MIVTNIVDTVRSLGNGFVRKDTATGEWVECEKVGQHFRNALGCQYKSSRRSKNKSEKQQRAAKVQALPVAMAASQGSNQSDSHNRSESIHGSSGGRMNTDAINEAAAERKDNDRDGGDQTASAIQEGDMAVFEGHTFFFVAEGSVREVSFLHTTKTVASSP